MNGESYRLRQSKTGVALRPAGSPTDTWTAPRSIPLRSSADAHRRVTLMLNTDRPVVRLCSAPWPNFSPPLTLVDEHDIALEVKMYRALRGAQEELGAWRMWW